MNLPKTTSSPCLLPLAPPGVHAGQPGATAVGHDVWRAVPHQRRRPHAAAAAGRGPAAWLGEWQELHGSCGAAGAVPAVPAAPYARGETAAARVQINIVKWPQHCCAASSTYSASGGIIRSNCLSLLSGAAFLQGTHTCGGLLCWCC